MPDSLNAMPGRDTLVAFYEQQLARYGPDDARSLHWISSTTQRIRFQVLYDLLHTWRGCSVADIGCGLGDLCGFLQDQGHQAFPHRPSATPAPRATAPSPVYYAGYDISPKLVEAAAQKYPQGHFLVRDILEEGFEQPSDYVVASGTLNIRVPEHPSFFRALVAAMYAGCTQAVAFNFLGPPSYSPMSESIYYSEQPEQVLELCRTLSHNVVINEGYFPGDYTIILRKP